MRSAINTIRTYAVEMLYRIWKPYSLNEQKRGLRLCKAIFNFQLRTSLGRKEYDVG